MKKRVKVTYLPKAVVGMRVTGKINNKDGSVVTGGYAPLSGGQGTPGVEVNRTIKPTTRENATLEAEKGETVLTNLTQGGIPEFYTIGGKRHSQGGTPLNLPADSFIFSRDNKMKIKDEDVLAQFGQNVKKGQKAFTPAELSKRFDLNPFRKILADPSSDHFQIKTAEMMIQNYNLKLGGLALAQESIKGFPNGIPGVAMPYLENVGIDPASLIPKQEQQQLPQARYGGAQWPSYAPGGFINTEGDEGNTVPPYANYNFQGVAPNAESIDQYYADLSASGENVDRERYFNAWNATEGGKQFPYSTDLNPNLDQGLYSPVKSVTAPVQPTPIQQQQASFTPGFTEIDGKQYQTRPTTDLKKYPSGTFNQATNKAMAGLYAKKFGIANPYKAKGGEAMPQYQYEGEVREEDYTTQQDANAYNADAYSGVLASEEQMPPADQYINASNTPQPGELIRMNEQGAYEVVDTEGNVIGKVSVPKTSSQSTKSQNIPKQAVKWDMSTEGYEESEVQPGDYVKQTNGKWYKVTGYKKGATAYSGNKEDLDPVLKGKFTDARETYGRLKQRIEENPELKQAIIDQYKIKIGEAKPGKNLTALDIEKAKGLTPDQIMKNFYRAQKQNMAVAANKGSIDANSDVWDKDRNHYINTVSELGLTPMEPWETAAFQGTYNGLVDIAKKPEYKELLEDFQLRPVGKKDEPMGRISNIDGWYGNTTIGEMAKYKPIAKQIEMKEAAWRDNPQVNHMKEQMQGMKTPFWTEDIVNLGFGLKNLTDIKRYRPWNAMPGTKLPRATFMTPDQQIQNILGATNIGAQGAAAFGSPQGYMANFAGLHGNAMNQVAKAIGNVQDKNVQIANRSEMIRSQIMNQANSKRGQLATNLHDKNTIMNQQYDNSKRQAWDAIRQNLNSAWTNRGMTQNMNTFNDQYYIDPQTGYKHFYNPRDLQAKNSKGQGLYDQASIYKSDHPDMQWSDAIKLARANKGLPAQSPTGFAGVDPNTMTSGYPVAAGTGYYPEEGA